ncbi:hypothetical protein ACFSBJ_15760 [Haloplanus ruber]|uniref:Uncharacterized protein n=1 Tax=Haloplanus ruber TaxID=869892 RepID=A0ABD6D1V1_9EURY|nr:hypothetical protein [Haloplanus ruber]
MSDAAASSRRSRGSAASHEAVSSTTNVARSASVSGMVSQLSSHRTGDPARATTTTAGASGEGVTRVHCCASTVVGMSVRWRVVVEGESDEIVSPHEL